MGISLVMVFLTSHVGAACTVKVEKEILQLLKSQNFRDTDKIEKLYEQCNDGFVLMLLSLSKGDRFEDLEQTSKAVREYKVALNALDGLDKKIYDAGELKTYIMAQLDKYSSIKSEQIQRGYLGTRGAKGTRGAGLMTKKQLAIPLNFETNKWTIKKGVNMHQTKEIAKALKSDSYRGKIIYITGYTDTRGKAEYNYKLGEHRARALKKYLKKVGLRNKIILESEGEEVPICLEGIAKEIKDENYICTIKEDYYSSRRVEISIGG